MAHAKHWQLLRVDAGGGERNGGECRVPLPPVDGGARFARTARRTRDGLLECPSANPPDRVGNYAVAFERRNLLSKGQKYYWLRRIDRNTLE